MLTHDVNQIVFDTSRYIKVIKRFSCYFFYGFVIRSLFISDNYHDKYSF